MLAPILITMNDVKSIADGDSPETSAVTTRTQAKNKEPFCY